MALTLESVKAFLRIDGTYEDGVINSLLDAAEAELQSSGVRQRDPAERDFPLYEKAVKFIVERDYDGRVQSPTEANRSDKVIQSLILKLREYPVKVVDDEQV